MIVLAPRAIWLINNFLSHATLGAEFTLTNEDIRIRLDTCMSKDSMGAGGVRDHPFSYARLKLICLFHISWFIQLLTIVSRNDNLRPLVSKASTAR